MSELTPTENYKNYVKLMDSMTIQEELAKINAIHYSLNETNPRKPARILLYSCHPHKQKSPQA